MNEFSKGAGHKINIQKWTAFPYASSEEFTNEIKETIPFTVAS